MTRSVKAVDVKEDLRAVRQVLRTEKIHHVPIVDGDALVGIISSRDLLRIYRDAFAKEAPSSEGEPTIALTMQTEMVTMRPDEKVERAIDILADGEIHSIPIVDRDDRLVGILTNIDLLEYVFG
jgi:CBS-domain-containing membrane protein